MWTKCSQRPQRDGLENVLKSHVPLFYYSPEYYLSEKIKVGALSSNIHNFKHG